MMTRKNLLQIMTAFFVLAIGIAAALNGLPNLVQAQERDQSQSTAVVGTAFTYQGRLVYNGTPVNGACDLVFRLRDASTFQVGSNFRLSSVNVSDGFFTVDLDFGSNAFTGEERWLEIGIDSCPGGASGVVLSPTIKLNPAPYALSLRPGAVISGSVASGSGLTVVNSSGKYGIIGQNDSQVTEAIGVYGTASSTTSEVYGVQGSVSSSDSASAGVKGVSTTGSGSGVEGVTVSSSNNAAGMYGFASATTSRTFGVYGITYGSGDGAAGVRGHARASSGETYGVYGQSDSPTGFGIYSEGNTHVEGKLSWKPVTSFVAVSPAAFQPSSSAASYIISSGGNWLRNTSGSAEFFIAPVDLPHGAVVTKMNFYWYDFSAVDGSADLIRNNLDQTTNIITSIATTGSSGNGSSQTSGVNYTVDNSNNSYLIRVLLPDATVELNSVIIEYTIDEPY